MLFDGGRCSTKIKLKWLYQTKVTMVHINRSQWVLKKNLSGQLHQCFKFSTWFIETKHISPQTRESLDPLTLQTHIKFVILLTVNHTIHIMLVQRIKYWINWLSPNWLMGVNSHEWPRQNLSLQYQYNIKQKMNKNTEKYQLGVISWSNTRFSKLTSEELYGRW